MTRTWMALLLTAWTCMSVVAADFPTNNDPALQIRFNTAAEAEARREKLIHFIWDGGLPDTRPTVTEKVEFPAMAVGIDPNNVARVDQLDVDVSGWGFHSIAYLMHPRNTANAHRVVIVHQGHGHNLEAGVGSTANHLLANGFTIVAMKMPLFGWAKDRDADIPGQGKIHYNSHSDMILKTGPKDGGLGFRLFLEPIVQVINHVVATNPKLQEVDLVGLSGGGWTASMMSAIDKRIRLSVPVAGSAPLYHRNKVANAVGDPEQYYAPLYAEDIKPDGSGGGVATWLEIYCLGGIGEGRRQIQVTNEFDSCCFDGTFPDKYVPIVTEKVRSIGGEWGYLRDSTHNVHQISNFTMAKAIDPLFGIEHPLYPSGLPVVEGFDGASKGLPKGWDLDPHSGAGASAVEEDGCVTIGGPALASIVRGAPLNPQRKQAVTLTLKIRSISDDNFAGVFITDEIGPRPHQVGPLVNVTTKEIGLNADDGKGFNTADRLILGKLPTYAGGPATLSLTFDADGFSVDLDAGEQGRFASGRHKWSEIPNGFNPANLGPHVQLFIQSSDNNGGTPASMKVDAVEVR